MNKKLILIVVALCLMLPIAFSIIYTQEGYRVVHYEGQCLYYDDFNEPSNVEKAPHYWSNVTGIQPTDKPKFINVSYPDVFITGQNWTGTYGGGSTVAGADWSYKQFFPDSITSAKNASTFTIYPMYSNDKNLRFEYGFFLSAPSNIVGASDRVGFALARNYSRSYLTQEASRETFGLSVGAGGALKTANASLNIGKTVRPSYPNNSTWHRYEIGVLFDPSQPQFVSYYNATDGSLWAYSAPTYANLTSSYTRENFNQAYDLNQIVAFEDDSAGFYADYMMLYYGDDPSVCFSSTGVPISDGVIENTTGEAIFDYGNCTSASASLASQGWTYYEEGTSKSSTKTCENGQICSNVSVDSFLYRDTACKKSDVITYTFALNISNNASGSVEWSDADIWLNWQSGNISVYQFNGSDIYLKQLCSNCWNQDQYYSYTIQKMFAPNTYSKYYKNGILKESSFPSFRLIRSTTIKSDDRYAGLVVTQDMNFTNQYAVNACRSSTNLWSSQEGAKFCIDDYVGYRGFNPAQNDSDYYGDIDNDPPPIDYGDRECAIRSSFAGIVVQDCGDGGYERNPAYYDKSNSVYFEWDERCTAQGYSTADWIPCPVKLFVYDSLNAVYGWIIGFTIIALIAIILIALFTNFGRK